MTGKNNTIFAPTENMQRQDVVSMYYRMAGEPYVVYRNIYSDVSSSDYFAKAAVWAVSGYALPYVRWAVEQKLIGQGGNRLRPQDYINRADIAVMIYRFLCL